MNRKIEFGAGMIYTVTNYIWYFLMANLYFWIVNIPIIAITLVMGISGHYSLNLLLILALLPVGPALTALFSIMGKLTREGELDVTKDFFKAYKVNFLESLFFWGIGVLVVSAIWLDILIFNSNAHLYFWGILPRAILFICLVLVFYLFPILSRFYLKRKDVLKLAFMYLGKKAHIGILSIIAIFFLWTIISNKNGAIILLFSASIIGYLVMFLEKGMLQEIEENLKNS